ncbi:MULTISPECIES: hypothetical protein [Micrococcus]|uniref:hypothetical protein n=1 Tax=Micrococcus antarcticus TaxID=86171 RepID=UPI0026153604|nr:hypothetical protein [uncultured Micrococcus sp.]
MRGDLMKRRGARRALPLAVLGTGAALLLSGCGADGGDAPEAWAKARTQLEQADSVRMVTELRSGAQTSAGATVPDSTDISGPTSGEAFRYVSEFRDGAYTTRDESRTVDGRTYSRFTLEERGGVAGEDPEYAEKWTAAKATGDPSAQGMGAMVDSLLAALPAGDGLDGKEADADTLRRSGQDAVRYVLDVPASGEGGGVALRAFTVAQDDGELLTVETESAGTGAVTTFSEWNAVPPIEAPAEDAIAEPAAAPAT